MAMHWEVQCGLSTFEIHNTLQLPPYHVVLVHISLTIALQTLSIFAVGLCLATREFVRRIASMHVHFVFGFQATAIFI